MGSRRKSTTIIRGGRLFVWTKDETRQWEWANERKRRGRKEERGEGGEGRKMAGALWLADLYAASNIVMRISDSPLNWISARCSLNDPIFYRSAQITRMYNILIKLTATSINLSLLNLRKITPYTQLLRTIITFKIKWAKLTNNKTVIRISN